MKNILAKHFQSQENREPVVNHKKTPNVATTKTAKKAINASHRIDTKINAARKVAPVLVSV